MYCGKCGKEIIDGAAYCSGCGIPVEVAIGNVQAAESSANIFVGKKKNHILWIVAPIVVMIIVIIVGLGVYHSPQKKYERQISLGERYLEDLDYVQAVAAYRAAIGLDPKNPEAYKALAETYILMEDEAAAKDILEQGLRQTEDRDLRKLLSQVDEQIAIAAIAEAQKDDGSEKLIVEAEEQEVVEVESNIEPVPENIQGISGISVDQARDILIRMDDNMHNYIWAILMSRAYGALMEVGGEVDIVLSDSEKVRAAVLASNPDGRIDDYFVLSGDTIIRDSTAESGPYGEGYHGWSVSLDNVERNCRNLFGTKAEIEDLQLSEKGAGYDAVKYQDPTGTYALIINDEIETETDQKSNVYRVTEQGDYYIGEVELYSGYWGVSDAYPDFSNYLVRYTLIPDNGSEYRLVISTMTIERIADESSLLEAMWD